MYLEGVSSHGANSFGDGAPYPIFLSNFVKNSAETCGASLSLPESPSAALECDDVLGDMVEGMRLGS